MHWVAAHPVAAPLLYLATYILVAALSLPQAAMVTVAGGLLFGTVPGTILTIIGATTGAATLVAAARTAFSDMLDRHRRRIFPEQCFPGSTRGGRPGCEGAWRHADDRNPGSRARPRCGLRHHHGGRRFAASRSLAHAAE